MALGHGQAPWGEQAPPRHTQHVWTPALRPLSPAGGFRSAFMVLPSWLSEARTALLQKQKPKALTKMVEESDSLGAEPRNLFNKLPRTLMLNKF